MKLKPKHFEIAKTISWFVDRNYFPDFIEPTREQIELFTQVESSGYKDLTDKQWKIVEPMLDGKSNYDLQIKMIHEELKEWVESGWGWYAPMSSILRDAFKERSQCKTYIKMLIRLWRKLETDGGCVTLMQFSGFTEKEKNDLINRYFKNF